MVGGMTPPELPPPNRPDPGHYPYLPPPLYPPPPPGVYRTTNGLATWSLVLALLWGFGVLSVVAIMFGHMALEQIRERGQDGRSIAVTGLIFGYLGLLPAAFLLFTGLLAGVT